MQLSLLLRTDCQARSHVAQQQQPLHTATFRILLLAFFSRLNAGVCSSTFSSVLRCLSCQWSAIPLTSSSPLLPSALLLRLVHLENSRLDNENLTPPFHLRSDKLWEKSTSSHGPREFNPLRRPLNLWAWIQPTCAEHPLLDLDSSAKGNRGRFEKSIGTKPCPTPL